MLEQQSENIPRTSSLSPRHRNSKWPPKGRVRIVSFTNIFRRNLSSLGFILFLKPSFNLVSIVIGSQHRKPSKRKLPSMEELISKGKEFLGIGRKKLREKTHYEFSTDPITGIRSNKGTYSGRLQKKRKQTSDKSTETFEFSCSGTLSILLWVVVWLLMQFHIANKGTLGATELERH